MIKEATVKLKIWYDDTLSDHPAKWDWNTLLDLGAGRVYDDCEGVELIEVDGETAKHEESDDS